MTASLTNIGQRTELAAEQRQSNGMLNPQNITEALQIADVMSKSNIVPKDYQGNPGNIVVAIQWGMELGLPPLQAMQNIAVINGRPSLWGDAVIALVRGSGLMEYMREDATDDAATCIVKRKGEPETSRTFSKEDAKRAGLLGKQGPWQQYPKRMLQMRARAWALRDVFPDVLKGIAVAEEQQDTPPERDMGTAQRAEPDSTSNRTASVKAKLAARQPKAQGPSLDDVLTAIERAADMAALKAVPAGELADASDKAIARKAWKAKQSALKAAADAEADKGEQLADSLIEAAASAHSDDERAEILDAARDLSPEQVARVKAAFPAD